MMFSSRDRSKCCDEFPAGHQPVELPVLCPVHIAAGCPSRTETL